MLFAGREERSDDGSGMRSAHRALVRLGAVDGLGPRAVASLLAAFGTPDDALGGSAGRWAEALGCSPDRADRCLRAALAADIRPILDATHRIGASLVGLTDAAYPALLRAIHDPPPLLWVCGAFQEIDEWSVAIVGSRRCSAYGLDQAGRFARGLAERGHPIVSGGARGIDGEAHRSTLRAGGRTIAVLGSGLACPYPPEHEGLFREIVASGGAVISEHPPTTEPRSAYFPRRNRIIAGLSIAVVLVEARARSGAAITARLAVEDHGREALAVPGRVDSPTSEGSHRAIREGWAALVASADDVVEHLRGKANPRALQEGAKAIADPLPLRRRDGGPERGLECPAPLTEGQRRLARRLVDGGAQSLAILVDTTGGEAGTLIGDLTMLELGGLVRRDDAGRWEARERLIRLVESVAPP